MKWPRIIAKLASERWAATPHVVPAIANTLRAHEHGAAVSAVDGVDSKPALPTVVEGVAVLPVAGIIGKKLSLVETACGGCDVDAVGLALDGLVARADVRAVVLDFDSPGGTVTGVHELAARIRAAARSKPIVAFTESQCCSAAYWLASQADAVFITPTAELGSVGVYTALIDQTRFFEREGFKLELIKAGEFKAAGIAGKSLTDAERALIQGDINQIYQMFVTDIRARRPSVHDDVLQGQTFRGVAAVESLLADAVVANVAEAARLASQRADSRGVAVSTPAPAEGPKNSINAASPLRPAKGQQSLVLGGVPVPSPRDDAEALAIYGRLAGVPKCEFYKIHEAAIWRAYRRR